MDEVIVTVSSTCANIVAIIEAWQIVPEVCTIENFELFHHLRANRRERGMALFSPRSIHMDLVSALQPQPLTPPCQHPRGG